MARSRRNDFVAGLFIIAALLALAAVLWRVTKWEDIGRVTRTYHVRFNHAPGIKVGSEVQLGGVPVGEVTGRELITPEDTQSLNYRQPIE